MPYAVDLAALTSTKVRKDIVLQVLLVQVLDMEHPIECMPNKAAGGVGMPMRCDEERAEAIATTIRLKYRHDELPIYYSRTGTAGWRYDRECAKKAESIKAGNRD